MAAFFKNLILDLELCVLAPQLLQVLTGGRRRVGNPSTRFLFKLESPIAQMTDPNPECPCYLCLRLLAKSRLANGFELELTTVSCVRLAWHGTPSQSEYRPFRCVHQTWVRPRAAVPNVRANQTMDKLRISAKGCTPIATSGRSMALLLPWRLHKLKRQWIKCTATIKPALRLRDEVRDDPCSARGKCAHVMPHFREFDPLRVAADDLSDATAFVWFGNRINCPSQY